jgi:hypothetical protein
MTWLTQPVRIIAWLEIAACLLFPVLVSPKFRSIYEDFGVAPAAVTTLALSNWLPLSVAAIGMLLLAAARHTTPKGRIVLSLLAASFVAGGLLSLVVMLYQTRIESWGG